MRILLATIFLLALTGPAIVQFTAGNRVARIHGTAVGAVFDDGTTIGAMTFHDDSRYCPWWIDPELWWNQSCTGGLPPRLPVPEGLR